ncbi:thioredoxin family protein [Rufibacter tibetensis]|uniref:Thioredoxin domain-containing protein n=1 Tax=Rufibacter tibetensis TaxID=512763 RepID=A0A0P0D1M9_9BACT|nr:thioredoxin family protein [Rufibacter tibetensis]ALJ01676.1 hypothetical protein DC20_21725 [Rufibacter tibetensis]
MKNLLFVALALAFRVANAQQVPGVKFEQGLSWSQIQEKARKENKYIFLDAYTTWCKPCVLMDKNIFPQQKVGEFFNAYFISVKVQMDNSKKDTGETIKWRPDAERIKKGYNVESFPTFLFFDPKGEIVHRIEGASNTGEEFIAKAEGALSPHQKLKRKYEAGEKDPETLAQLARSAFLMRDRKLLPTVANEYLATQQDLLTEENLRYIGVATQKTTDPGFPVLRHQGDRADLVLGKGKSKGLVNTIVFDEIVFPQLVTNGVKKSFGQMSIYSGEAKESPDWPEIEKNLNGRFPELSGEVLLSSRVWYLRRVGKWSEYISLIEANKGKIGKEHMNQYANDLMIGSDDPEILAKALKWTEWLLEGAGRKNTDFLVTHSQLLYKAGKREEAIKAMTEVVQILDEKDGALKLLAQMKNGEKI